MESIAHDLRFAFRALRRRPAWTLVAVATLAVGTGATTALFSVVKSTLLDPLPYPEPAALTMVWSRFDRLDAVRARISGPELVELRDQSRLFEDFGGIWARFGSLTDNADPEQIDIGYVTASFFDVLGIRPSLGRNLLAEETRPNGPNVIVLSHGVWQRRYGANPSIVGSSVEFNGAPYTVVGIMPSTLALLLPSDANLPARFGAWLPWQDNYATMDPDWHLFSVVGRLRAGVSHEQAQAELDAVAARLRERHGEYAERGLRLETTPLQADLVAPIKPGLLALFGAAAFLTLIACANVTGLIMLRTTVRAQEIAVRVALGADRLRVVRHVLTETFVLFVMGGVAGWFVAGLALDLLVAIGPTALPRIDAVTMNLPVLAFTVGAVLITALAFGTLPALRVGRDNLSHQLRVGPMHGGGQRRTRFGGVLVVTEIALAVVLAIGAGLMLRSMTALQRVDRGFDPDGVVTLRLSLPFTRYPYENPDRISGFYRQLWDEVVAMPAVDAAGFTELLPLATTSSNSTPYAVIADGRETEWGTMNADYRVVTPGYFETAGASIAAGRLFTEQDDAQHPPVVIVDETLATRVWGSGDPIGRRIKISQFYGGDTFPTWANVVGVVSHLHNVDLRAPGVEQIYLPHAQSPRRSMTLAIRSAAAAGTLIEDVRRRVLRLDPALPIFGVRPMAAYLYDATASIRYVLSLIGVFAALALGLASVGVYGLVGADVRRRTHEIGVRLALGADAPEIFRRVIGRGAILGALGVGVGVLVALAATRALDALVYGVALMDPTTLVAVSGILMAVTVAACYVPARRATRIDPIRTLRAE